MSISHLVMKEKIHDLLKLGFHQKTNLVRSLQQIVILTQFFMVFILQEIHDKHISNSM